MPKPDLDAIDRRIVAALQANGRLTNVELAERVGLSPSPCLRLSSGSNGKGTSRRIGPCSDAVASALG
jgi:DNA-binding Lrp family transcriptional regulator